MPDFGSFRGFGEKLTQGQTPTNLGKIGSDAFGFDTDFLAFFNRVVTDGGTLSYLEQIATNQLILNLKSYSLWTKMKAIYPMVGASAASCAQNLKSSSFTGTFNGGWTYANTGVTGNGTNGYMNTLYKPSVDSTIDSVSISIYTRKILSENRVPIGCRDNGGTFQITPGYNGTTTFFDANVGQDSGIFNISTNSQGFFQAIRQGAAACIGLRNATIYSANLNQYRPPYYAYIGASNVLGSPGNYSTNEIAFASFGDSLTNTEASNFYIAVQAFQTTLSRQV